MSSISFRLPKSKSVDCVLIENMFKLCVASKEVFVISANLNPAGDCTLQERTAGFNALANFLKKGGGQDFSGDEKTMSKYALKAFFVWIHDQAKRAQGALFPVEEGFSTGYFSSDCDFKSITQADLALLIKYRNIMIAALDSIAAKNNKTLLMFVCEVLTAGRPCDFATGSGQNLYVRRRVAIYEQEGDIKAAKSIKHSVNPKGSRGSVVSKDASSLRKRARADSGESVTDSEECSVTSELTTHSECKHPRTSTLYSVDELHFLPEVFELDEQDFSLYYECLREVEVKMEAVQACVSVSEGEVSPFDIDSTSHTPTVCDTTHDSSVSGESLLDDTVCADWSVFDFMWE